MPMPNANDPPVESFGPFLWGLSPRLREVREMLPEIQQSAANVRIEGATGSGKEHLAWEFHRTGPRCGGPFVIFDVCGIAETLKESESFGHEKAAFTGADAEHLGLFEAAQGGTAMVDEIAEASLELQSRLLRILDRKQFRRVGSTKLHRLDAQIIVCTNRDLEQRVKQCLFREDLYFRLGRTVLRLPSLGERREDIPALLGHFLGVPPSSLFQSKALRFLFAEYPWPGNVRELREIARAGWAQRKDAPLGLEKVRELLGAGQETAGSVPSSARRTIKDFDEQRDLREEKLLRKAIERADGNRARAARLLGLKRPTFYRKLAKHGLLAPPSRNASRESLFPASP